MQAWKAVVPVLALCSMEVTGEEFNNDIEPRASFVSTGQEVSDYFIGLAWSRMAGSEFVGDSTADVYANKNSINPTVETKQGKLKGIISMTSRDGKPYSAYLGIPFAEPPVGERRFKAPEAPKPWEDILDATKERSTCLTFREPDKGSEDCLYLNVFTPCTTPKPSDVKKPVMVFIYGGAFMGGSSNTSGYAPDFLLDKDVVVVTFNYRIGPLGFLSLQNEEVPGNAGLKDQKMALLWVKQNINNFCGDPERVTIFGESAGAASVSYHIMSPASEGLFQRAIMESGSSVAGWAYMDPHTAREKAFVLGRRVGCVYPAMFNQTHNLYECLKQSPASLITRLQGLGINMKEVFQLHPLTFVPTREPPLPGAFITKTPLEYLESGRINKVPVIAGINTAEALLFYGLLRKVDPTEMYLVQALGEDMTALVPRELRIPSDKMSYVNQKLKQFYSKGNGMTGLEFLQAISDTQFLLPMLRTSDLISKHSRYPVFNYLFSFDGRYTCLKIGDEFKNIPGTAHMDELGYLLNLGPLKKTYNHTDRERPEEKVIDILTSLWTQFAASGRPTLSEAWDKFTHKETKYYDISTTPRQEVNVQNETVKFWNDIYEEIGGSRVFPQ